MVLENALVKLFSPSKRSVGTPISGVSSFFGFSGFRTSATPVSQNQALTLSAFYNGVEILTNDIALPSKQIYKKDGAKREAVHNHPVKYLISKKPNQYMTAFMFHKMLGQYAILKGNGYALTERNPVTAAIKSLQLITEPVTVLVHNAQLFYKVKYKDGYKIYSSDDILHIPGFSFNGIVGIGVVQQAAQSLGVALKAQDYSADYYDSKGLGSGYIKTDKNLEPTAKTSLSTAFSNVLSNQNKWSVPVLDEGMSFHPIQITASEAQFLLTSKHGISEVARWLNIPSYKLKDLDNANRNNMEVQEIQHKQDSVLPWVTKFEQEYNAKLFTEKEKQTHFVKFNLNTIMRADIKSQAEYFSKMGQLGVLDRNEIRALLDYNPKDGLSEALTPVNTQTMEQVFAKLKLIEEQIKSVNNGN